MLSSLGPSLASEEAKGPWHPPQLSREHAGVPPSYLRLMRKLVRKGERKRMAITLLQLENWFTYHPPTPEQLPAFQSIRDAGFTLAKVIWENSPGSADQTAAIRKVREAVMTANAAIACKGQ